MQAFFAKITFTGRGFSLFQPVPGSLAISFFMHPSIIPFRQINTVSGYSWQYQLKSLYREGMILKIRRVNR
jgi:hypothetical protein